MRDLKKKRGVLNTVNNLKLEMGQERRTSGEKKRQRRRRGERKKGKGGCVEEKRDSAKEPEAKLNERGRAGGEGGGGNICLQCVFVKFYPGRQKKKSLQCVFKSKRQKSAATATDTPSVPHDFYHVHDHGLQRFIIMQILIIAALIRCQSYLQDPISM